LVVTNSATDSDAPANTLTYALVNPPAGASIDASGLISYTPPPDLTPATYTITTVVTDDGQPPLSDTNSFFVTISPLRTNVVLNVKIALTAYTQVTTSFVTTNGGTTNVTTLRDIHQAKIATADVISALGSQTGNHFSAGAKLIFVFGNAGTANAKNGFFVRSGGADTDVSQYLQLSGLTAEVVRSRTNPSKGTVRDLSYQILETRLNTTKGDFDVQGLATLSESTLLNKGRIVNSDVFITGITITVAGSGHQAGLLTMYKGTLTATAGPIETKPVPGP
jgi:hypothetical protein